MNIYLKTFIISFIVFCMILGGTVLFLLNKEPDVEPVHPQEKEPVDVVEIDDTGDEPEIEPFKKVIMESNRINGVVFGTDGDRADTIMFVSYDPKLQLLDVLSIPRDTYHYVEGFERKDQKKINAVYGMGKKHGGSLGVKQQIANLLGVPVHYYVKVSYSGVSDIVDLIGGVRVNVPFNMDYDDEWCEPPLHIHIAKGDQVLNGSNSVKYLRWRQNNDGGHSNGDLARITRQQNFVKSAMKKVISPKLPVVIKSAYNYVHTDMGLNDMIYYGNKFVDFNMDNIQTYKLPGLWKGYYYVHDIAKSDEILQTIYTRENENAQKIMSEADKKVTDQNKNTSETINKKDDKTKQDKKNDKKDDKKDAGNKSDQKPVDDTI